MLALLLSVLLSQTPTAAVPVGSTPVLAWDAIPSFYYYRPIGDGKFELVQTSSVEGVQLRYRVYLNGQLTADHVTGTQFMLPTLTAVGTMGVEVTGFLAITDPTKFVCTFPEPTTYPISKVDCAPGGAAALTLAVGTTTPPPDPTPDPTPPPSGGVSGTRPIVSNLTIRVKVPPESITAPTVVQMSDEVNAVNGVATVTLPNVAAGNTLVVALAQTGSALRTYTGNDSTNGQWRVAEYLNPGRAALIAYRTRTTAGDVAVTMRASSSTTFRFRAYEVRGIDPFNPVDVTSEYYEPVVTATHTCGHPDGVTTSSNVIVFCASQLNASSGIGTAGEGYTGVQLSGGDPGFVQYRSSVAPLENEAGRYTFTSTQRRAISVLVSFHAVR